MTTESASSLRSTLRLVALNLGLAVVYLVLGKLGLRLAVVHPSATPVWPPSGLAFAALLLLGSRVWPGILVGAFLVNLTTAGTVATSVAIAAGNTLEGVIGVWLVKRYAHGSRVFDREEDILRFAFLAGMLATAVSATLGTGSLTIAGFARPNDAIAIWLSWWLGDMTGVLLLAPVIVLWGTRPVSRWRPRDVEASLLLLSLLLLALSIFGGVFHRLVTLYPLFVCIPFLLWAALRFTQRQAATATLLMSAVALWGTMRGYGPFALLESRLDSMLMLQGFTAIMSVMTLSVTALVNERRRNEEKLHRLAINDPLTGLVNQRRFLDVLKDEIRRSQRTSHPFAVLLLDLDGLKAVNDRHGHLVGSRALCRLADILRASCRSTDTAARFGGDEFAMILVETGASPARFAAQRVCEQLAADGEQPSLSVSAGVAVFPDDGETADALLSAADRAMYSMKSSNRMEGTA